MIRVTHEIERSDVLTIYLLNSRFLKSNSNATFLKAKLCVIFRGNLLLVNTGLHILLSERFPLVFFFQYNQEVTTFKWHSWKGIFAFVTEINLLYKLIANVIFDFKNLKSYHSIMIKMNDNCKAYFYLSDPQVLLELSWLRGQLPGIQSFWVPDEVWLMHFWPSFVKATTVFY